MVGKDDRQVSEVTSRAVAFVAAHREPAVRLGRELDGLANDPEAFARHLRVGLARLADPEYLEGQRRVAPGIGPIGGVRRPLIEAVRRGLRQSNRGGQGGPWLDVADRLLRDESLEAQWLEAQWVACGLLERAITHDPERAWQLVRRASRNTGDWITVDTLAHVAAKGILEEPYRWAELEQLVYAPSPWERRLVGSTIATLPVANRRRGREPFVAERGLAVIGQLMGDDEPAVQKALSWALRSLTLVDRRAVESFCEGEAAIARERHDGHRAWVIRDALVKLDPKRASAIRDTLSGIRRRAGAPATSSASAAAAALGAGLLGRPFPEPPPSLNTPQNMAAARS